MAVIVSMLRGVNVGGHNMIKMDALRALYQSLKLQDPHTHVQSGNVVFRTDERNLVLLARRIENGIERSFHFRPDVILRTTSELRDVIARNPFATRRGIEPGKLLVTFLASDPEAEAREKVLKIKTDPEELSISGREVYIYYPAGMGRSKLSWITIANASKSGEDFDTSTPVDVLQQERGEKEIRTRIERRMLDVVFEHSSGETVPGEAFSQTDEEARIQVGADYSERSEDRRVQEVEHLARAGSHNRDASAGRGFGGLNDVLGEGRACLSLTDGGHVLFVVLGCDDLSPGAAEAGVHRVP